MFDSLYFTDLMLKFISYHLSYIVSAYCFVLLKFNQLTFIMIFELTMTVSLNFPYLSIINVQIQISLMLESLYLTDSNTQ